MQCECGQEPKLIAYEHYGAEHRMEEGTLVIKGGYVTYVYRCDWCDKRTVFSSPFEPLSMEEPNDS